METVNGSINQEPTFAEAIKVEQQAYQGMGIKILSVASGLLASGFLSGWVFLLLGDSAVTMVILGPVVLILAVFLDNRINNMVLDTACIGAYVAACAMIGFGIEKLSNSDNFTTLVMLVIAVAVPFFSIGYMFNFLSVIAINICLFSLININDWFDLIHVLVALVTLVYTLLSLKEPKYLAFARMSKVYNPLRNGLLCSLLGLLSSLAVNRMVNTWQINHEWISSAAIIGIILFFLHHIVTDLGIAEKRNRNLIYLVSGLVLLLAFFVPAVCGALLILMISFHTGHRLGLIFGLAALFYFTGQYYYNLEYTLLVKSEIMMATGALFMLAWVILKKTLKRYEQD
ncbi:MAG TPA: DUF4401 domain-containing protein [Pedobacter sp.]|nr:DUF4401 domain-containing protein [Pedobacter sp.]